MKWLTALSGSVIALGLLAAPASAKSDLPTSYGFYEEMTYLMDKGVVSGYPDGTVQPDKIVTRAEAAIMIGKMKGFDGTQRASGFSDVPKSMKASGYIAAAKKAGYISGREDGTFRPDAPITRGDMALILANVFPSPEMSQGQFKDVTVGMRAYFPIMSVFGANIVTGYSDNTYKPLQATTRGQFSAFLARGLEPKFKNDTHMAHGFMRDKTKNFTYQYEDGVISNHSYVKHTAFDGVDLGFAWLDSTVTDGYYYEAESHESYNIGYPVNYTEIDAVYPIKVGTKLNTDPEDFGFKAEITGINQTVKTAYKTFTNAVEVSVEGYPGVEESGHKFYLVEGLGQVKRVENTGKVVFELIDVK